MAILDFVNFNGARLDLQDSASVHFDAEQELTDAQQTQARENIAAAGQEDLDDLESYVRDMSPLATLGPADIVSIDDAAPLTAEGLVVNVEPVQAGSGDPSPENIRPISGWDGVTVTDEGENGETRTASVDFGQTVYGGTVDLTTGECVVDRAYVARNASQFQTTSISGRYYTDVGTSGQFAPTNENLSNMAVSVLTSVPSSGQFYLQSGFLLQWQTEYESLADLSAAMNGTDFIFCGKLATPTTFTLTPAELELFKGTNNISADAGQVTVTYRQDVVSAMEEEFSEPHNYLFDGRDLSKVFGSAEAFHTALAAEDFSKIRVGDYWPLKLNGTFRDYGAYTVPSGTAYFTDAALTTQGGTTSAKIEGQYESATAVKFKVSGSNVYCAIGDCLDYFERTCNNAVVNLEVAGINNYWRYGDSGDLTGNNKPHITFVSRDCFPFTMRMRKANAVWENTEKANPWRGSALFKTLNDPDYGVVKLIAATTIGAYMYAGPNGGGMRALMETKAAGATTATSWGWADRGKLFLPFESEIWGHGVWGGNSGYTLGVNLQLPIFIGTRRHISKGIRNGASRYSWWTASSSSGSATIFCNVNSTGYPDYGNAVNAFCAPVCFVMI